MENQSIFKLRYSNQQGIFIESIRHLSWHRSRHLYLLLSCFSFFFFFSFFSFFSSFFFFSFFLFFSFFFFFFLFFSFFSSLKTRLANHKSSFNYFDKRNATELSKYVWELKNRNIDYIINWKLLKRAKPYSCASNRCNLC